MGAGYQVRAHPAGNRRALSFAIALIAALAVGDAGAVPKERPSVSRPVAFVHVDVVPMDSERIVRDLTVVVINGRIAAMGPAGAVVIPREAQEVDGRGKFLIPGLVDMHVHLRNYSSPDMAALLQLYVANGVTTVLNLSGTPRHLGMRDSVARGLLFGPTIYTSGPFISPTTGSSPTPEEVERAVIDQKRAGYDVIKIHGDFTREAYHRLFQVARREGRIVIGHAPRNLGPEVMIEERQDAVAHAEEYIYDKNSHSRPVAELDSMLPSLARGTARAGTWLVPNLTAFDNIEKQVRDINAIMARPEMKYLPPAIREGWGPATNPYVLRLKKEKVDEIRALYGFVERLTKAFHDAGVPLLAGTDAMNPADVPGFSLHDERRDLVAAGLTPYHALQAATSNPARFLRRARTFGTVAVGQRADLVLLDANPLEDITNAARRAGVMLRGRWLPQAELQGRLDSLVTSYRGP